MTNPSVVSLMLVSMKLCTFAVDSLVFEQFLANMCTSSADDVVLMDKSYYDCLNQCEARSDCTAVSYMQKTALCRMDFQGITPGECEGYVYSQKVDWKQASSNPCNCPMHKKCGQDGTCLVSECDKLHDPDNGQIFGVMFGIGDKVSYSCDFGYALNATRKRVCQANGSWSGEDVKCVEAGKGFIPLTDCYTSDVQLYTGTWNTSVSGRTCQRWDQQYPHNHTRHVGTYPPGETASKANNYCRDPDNEGHLWCYTIDPNVRWETCGIPPCI